MTGTPATNLNREKIQQLLSRIGVESMEDVNQNIEAVEYNWQKSHYFTNEQLKRLVSRANICATEISGRFSNLYQSEFETRAVSVSQHFADELHRETSVDDYCLAFGTENQPPCGYVNMPSRTAVAWASQLLGSLEIEEDPSANLSQLEESLVLDVASLLIGAFFRSYIGLSLHPIGGIVRSKVPLEFQSTDELCKITVSITEVDSKKTSQAQLCIFCDKLKSIVSTSSQTDEQFSAEDLSRALRNHLNQMPLSVTARLASVELSFEDVMGLEVNDILLLNKGGDEHIEVIVEDRRLFSGMCAKSAGRYAVVITERIGGTT